MSKLSAILAAGVMMLALGAQTAQAHDNRGHGNRAGYHHGHHAYNGKHWYKGNRHVRYIAPPYYARRYWAPVRYVPVQPTYSSSGFSLWLY